MGDTTAPTGDQPRATSQQLPDIGRDPSLTYRTAPIKTFGPRQQRRPSRS